MNTRRLVLVVEDDAEMRAFLEEELQEAGYDVRTAGDGLAGLEVMRSAPVDVVVTDLMMPGLKGQELLAEVRALDSSVPVVIMTAFGSIDSAVEAMRAGAFHYLPKPFRIEQLLATVESALVEWRQWRELATEGAAARASAVEIIGESQAMRRVIALALRAARADSPVLLLGESGTGKELLTRAIHAASPRRERRLLAVNCSAIPEHLLESQLFGHRRGAFTDAREDHRGMFQEADGGTLLLDEIGDMPARLQAKLLRVLQEREVQPVGAPAPVAVDVRIVAATHTDLERAVHEERFRQDLFYRLNVITIQVPPLRERMEDLVPLVQHFLHKHGPGLGRDGVRIEPAALEALRRHDWPGNARELENAIERALVLGQGDVLRVGDLPASLRGRVVPETTHDPASLAEMEREHILRTLHAVRGNRAAAARLLAVDRKTLYRKLKLYGLV